MIKLTLFEQCKVKTSTTQTKKATSTWIEVAGILKTTSTLRVFVLESLQRLKLIGGLLQHKDTGPFYDFKGSILRHNKSVPFQVDNNLVDFKSTFMNTVGIFRITSLADGGITASISNIFANSL